MPRGLAAPKRPGYEGSGVIWGSREGRVVLSGGHLPVGVTGAPDRGTGAGTDTDTDADADTDTDTDTGTGTDTGTDAHTGTDTGTPVGLARA